MIPKDLLPSFRNTLLSGHYNLLLGSGTSSDSRNALGKSVIGAEELRRNLCKVTGARETTSLTRVYALLNAEQRQCEIVAQFDNCEPGPSVRHLPNFLWRRLFTFNIDDVLEAAYLSLTTRKQDLVPLNFDAPFEPTPDRTELPCIHLHGWVKCPDVGFVFSTSEYIRAINSLNPWMHLLSEILATEPFIIAGTSLNEMDLEYYLSHRTKATPRRGRGPSLLIEPSPDIATHADCERYGLVLVPETFGSFMQWLTTQYPLPPSLSDLLVPDVSTLFPGTISAVKRLRFFSDFELVKALDSPLSDTPSPFLYGREPRWQDLDQHVDIERQDNAAIETALEKESAQQRERRMLLVLDEAGSGKTTTIKRVAHRIAAAGKPVLAVQTLSRIDVDTAIDCLSELQGSAFLLIDGLADHIEQIVAILDNEAVSSKVTVLASERLYRKEYIDLVLADSKREAIRLRPFTLRENIELIERYRHFGLVADKRAIREPRIFAQQLLKAPVAISVCRILNDFRPLDNIVESLWKAAQEDDRMPYLSVALAQHCYSAGVRYSILQRIVGLRFSVGRLMSSDVPLAIAPNARETEFVVTVNSVIGERVLHRASRQEPNMMLTAFTALASALAPHVNRRAIMRRSPERTASWKAA